ncbi:MAG TPA: c-type cytochrome [Epsilonproteobacteria bacterium]|nr:c-type cytochrome [Campylobacterota bacterium]
MRELKIVAIVVFFSLLTYYLVEPYAHSQMHKHVESHHFIYTGETDIEEYVNKIKNAKNKIEENTEQLKKEKDEKIIVSLKEEIVSLKESIPTLKKKEDEKKSFWSTIKTIATLEGNVTTGETGFSMCLGCHNGSGINMGGSIPPDLNHAGTLYNKNYLIALIKDPAMASNVDHKYDDTMMHPMASVKTMFIDDQSIADVVAYLMTKKAGETTPKEAYEDACGRCHAMRYVKLTQLGVTPKFKHEKDALAYKIKVIDEQDAVKAYMGKLPPDLSMMIRARSEHFMETFVENPQSQLPGTSMPRTGLSEEGYAKVKAYLEEVGDPSKPKREAVGPWILGFFFIFTILAFLWKKSMWKDLH